LLELATLDEGTFEVLGTGTIIFEILATILIGLIFAYLSEKW
jgi:hypothetical protein